MRHEVLIKADYDYFITACPARSLRDWDLEWRGKQISLYAGSKLYCKCKKCDIQPLNYLSPWRMNKPLQTRNQWLPYLSATDLLCFLTSLESDLGSNSPLSELGPSRYIFRLSCLWLFPFASEVASFDFGTSETEASLSAFANQLYEWVWYEGHRIYLLCCLCSSCFRIPENFSPTCPFLGSDKLAYSRTAQPCFELTPCCVYGRIWWHSMAVHVPDKQVVEDFLSSKEYWIDREESVARNGQGGNCPLKTFAKVVESSLLIASYEANHGFELSTTWIATQVPRRI